MSDDQVVTAEMVPAEEASATITASRGVRTIVTNVSSKINEIYERENIWERIIKSALELAENYESRSRKDGMRILVDIGKLGVNLQITEEKGSAQGSVEQIEAALKQLPDQSLNRLHRVLEASQ